MGAFHRWQSWESGAHGHAYLMLELLNQLDGVDACGDLKVILTTNRIETVFVLYM
jgi:ATP-dependent 26S proteasome regulatory subunit